MFGGEPALPDGVWPRAGVVAAVKARFGAVEDIGQEQGYALYGVTDRDVRFVVALLLVAGATDKISEIGFIARFTGFQLSANALEQANRRLHISVLADEWGELYLLGGVAATGAFNPATFTLVLEAWRRDLTIALQALAGGSVADAFGAARSAAAAQFATNAAPEKPEAMLAAFNAFAAGSGRALAACNACDGRGRIGLIARPCAACDGEGLVPLR
jgi:hypothetical protein